MECLLSFREKNCQKRNTNEKTRKSEAARRCAFCVLLCGSSSLWTHTRSGIRVASKSRRGCRLRLCACYVGGAYIGLSVCAARGRRRKQRCGRRPRFRAGADFTCVGPRVRDLRAPKFSAAPDTQCLCGQQSCAPVRDQFQPGEWRFVCYSSYSASQPSPIRSP